MVKKQAAVMLMGIVLFSCLFFRGDGEIRAVEIKTEDISDTSEKYEALSALNAVRSQMGLLSLAQSSALHNMALNHSRYMASARVLSFEELSGDKGYTGLYPIDRARYSGYDRPYVMEYDNRRMSTYTEYINWCLLDPALRVPLLSPGYTEIGFGREEVYYCMTLGGGKNPAEDGRTIVYPYAGQQNVGMVTAAGLSRIPQSLADVMGQTIGLPITVQYYRAEPSALRFENVSVELINTRTQSPVELIKVLPQEKDGINGAMMLFPTVRYQANTGYTVRVSFEVWENGEMTDTVEEEWSFMSAGPEYLGEVRRGDAIVSLTEAIGLRAEPVAAVEEPFPYADLDMDGEWEKTFDVMYRLLKDGVLTVEDAEQTEDEVLFRPDEFTTREQAAVWLMQLIRGYAPELLEGVELDYQTTFEDINRCSDRARDQVQLAYQLGLIRGQGGGIFNPQVQITQAEMDEIVEKVTETIHIPWTETAEPAESNPGQNE